MSRELKNGIFFVGALDRERTLFDGLIPLPDGTSYNSYLVRGSEKIALVDTVEPDKTAVLLGNLEELGVDKIDYVISHHAEQDHSGAIPEILARYPQAQVVTNPKCQKLLMSLLEIDEDRIVTVADGDTLSLGDKTFRFFYTPWVHWPETMCSYLEEDKIAFTCDFFGSHLAGDTLFVSNEQQVQNDAKRYFAQIMMPFRMQIRKNLEKIKALEIDLIAPSHGPVYDKPQMIIDAYSDWVSDTVKNQVVVPYVSMHGSTQKLVDYFSQALAQRSVAVQAFNLVEADIGELAIALVDAATVVIGSPTVLTGPHPAAAQAAFLINLLRPKTKFLSIICSYGWAGKTVEQLKEMTARLQVEFLEPVLVLGRPKRQDLQALDRLADAIVQKHQNIGII